MQRWPVEAKAPEEIAVAAFSRFASGSTTTAFLPPISQVTFAPRLAACSLSAMPTAFDPVKEIARTSGESTSVAPTSEPGPMTRLKTPAGTPASS